MAPNTSDLRNTRRFSLKLPLTVKFAEGTEQSVSAQTKDVSARGVFFYLNSDVAEGSPIEFTLTLPPEITLTESIRVHCTGKVVRVDQNGGPGSQVGIAAAIDQYDFVSE
ncbi:MAG: type pilus assembly PilZ [Candidatus Angelobacter sp.]|jgi:hypothetical protein|nr:type pilus assembly PilZ [Candidatus Angelobacter sp.]